MPSHKEYLCKITIVYLFDLSIFTHQEINPVTLKEKEKLK